MMTKIDNCRGNDKKEKICSDYEVKAIARMALLPNQKIEGCCGDLENEHTIFYYKHKRSCYEDTFSVGKDCAKAFLEILKQASPPLVDPLQNLQLSGTLPGGGQSPSFSTGSVSTSANTISAINSELYIAINLWCILKKQVPKYSLQRILTDIRTSPNEEVKIKDIFDFLKVLASYKKTLGQMLAEAKISHPNMKTYNFPELNAIASKNWIDAP